MQTNQVQGMNRNRNSNGGYQNNDNGNNGGNFGPMRDKRNNRNNARKPYNNGDSGFRNRGDMNSNNNRFGGFNNGDNFDNGRGGGNGNGDFGNNRGGGGGGGGGSGGGACGGVVGGGGFWNQQTNAQFGNRNNNCGDFQNDFGPTNRLMDLDFSRDFCGGNRFNDNGNSSYRTNFNGNGGGNGNANFSGGGNSQDCLVYVRGMPFYCDEMDLYDFFAPIKPTNCKVILNDKGRHSGNAEVYFRSRQDVSLAMQKNRDKMGSRYIELFDANDSRRPRF